MKYLGNELKYEACHVGVAYDADFDYCIEIRINRQNLSNLMTLSF